jgi:tetratricopeptide (TPR) repeat protein
MIKKTKMKKLFFAVLMTVSIHTQAQTIEEARKEIDNENYVRAINILHKVLKVPSIDRNLASYYLGNAYLKADELDSAKLFYVALGEGNRSPYGYLATGRLALLNKDRVKAKEAFDKAAIITKMKNSEVLYQAGDAYYRPEVIDLKQAISYFEDAYKLDVKNSTNMLALGDAYLDNNEGGKAMSKYESAAEVNSKLFMAFIKIGRLNVRARTYDDAITAFKRAVELEPNSAVAHKELGEVYYLSKKYDLAKPSLKKYIELNSEDAAAKTKFISFLFQIKEYEQVVSEASQMLIDDSTNYVLLRSLAYGNFELKRYKDGYEFAKKFWKNAPEKKVRPLDYVYSARLASLAGDGEQAITYFRTALATDSANQDLQYEYGKTLWQVKKFDEAIAQFNKKIAQFGGNSMDYFYLGRSYYSTKNFVEADKTFQLFADKNPTSPDGHIWRAKSNSNIDTEMKTGAAFPHYQKFIELAGGEPERNKRNLVEAYSYMAAYYANNKDMATAKQNLDKAIAIDPNDELVKELQKSIN